MLEVLKGGKNNNLARLLLEKLGQAPDCLFQGDHADMLVPRSNITESGKALVWLNGIVADLEKQEQFKGSDLVTSLKGLYFVFRDCSLMAKHYLGYREANTPIKRRGYDLMYRFTIDPTDRKQIRMEIGSAIPKDKITEKELKDEDDSD